MKKLKTPTAVTTAILTLITVFFWVAFEVYRAITARPAPVVPPEIILPLTPTLDQTALDKLQQRMHLTDEEVGTFVITTPSPSPTSEPTASASPAGSPSATPTSSP